MCLWQQYSYLLQRKCLNFNQISIICAKLCFSVSIWRKLLLNFIECSLKLENLLYLKQFARNVFDDPNLVILTKIKNVQASKKIQWYRSASIVDKDPCQIQNQLAETLNVTQPVISKPWKRYTRKEDGYHIKERDIGK